MITYLQSGNGYNEIDRWQPYCWVNVETPDNEEIAFLTGTLGIPEDFIGDVSDIDERPRVERNGEWILAILRIPVRSPEDGTPYRTVPMGVMICGETIISVCFYKNELTGDFIEHTRRRNIGVPSAADFTLRILNSSAYWFLHYLTEIKALREKAEKQLGQSIRNEDLLSMMSLQKVLVIFANSLKGNLLLIERLPKVWAGDVDSDLLDDVEIELRQAETMVDIDMTMLDHTMDTYASVISNNVNAIMKRLTSISVILMIPTLIASFYGMNVDVGVSSSNGWAFGAIVGVAVFLTTLTCLWLRRIKWL